MRKFLSYRAVELPIVAIAFATLAADPAWAGIVIPGPAAGGLAGAAIVGAIVIARLWRRK